MTAGTRPSRRTERAAPLPVPLRVTAASCLIAAMMMSFTWVAPCLQGCRNRRETRAYREGARSEQEPRLAFGNASSQMLVPEKESHDERDGETRKLAYREGCAWRGASAGRAFVGRADRALPPQFRHRGRAASLGAAGHPSLRPIEEMRGAGQSRA